MSLPKEKAWFPAKRYGYGWGFPSRWQGWIATLVYVTAIAGGGVLLRAHLLAFVLFTCAATGVFWGLCSWKGEAARWRWGGDDKPPATP